jgi:hypothetical protein
VTCFFKRINSILLVYPLKETPFTAFTKGRVDGKPKNCKNWPHLGLPSSDTVRFIPSSGWVI